MQLQTEKDQTMLQNSLVWKSQSSFLEDEEIDSNRGRCCQSQPAQAHDRLQKFWEQHRKHRPRDDGDIESRKGALQKTLTAIDHTVFEMLLAHNAVLLGRDAAAIGREAAAIE